MIQHVRNSYKLKIEMYLLPYKLCLRNRSHVSLNFVSGFLLSGLFLQSLDFCQFGGISDGIVALFAFLFVFFVRFEFHVFRFQLVFIVLSLLFIMARLIIDWFR